MPGNNYYILKNSFKDPVILKKACCVYIDNLSRLKNFINIIYAIFFFFRILEDAIRKLKENNTRIVTLLDNEIVKCKYSCELQEKSERSRILASKNIMVLNFFFYLNFFYS